MKKLINIHLIPTIISWLMFLAADKYNLDNSILFFSIVSMSILFLINFQKEHIKGLHIVLAYILFAFTVLWFIICFGAVDPLHWSSLK